MLVTLIVPVFNEEDSIDLFLKSVEATFVGHVNVALEFIFINDGSSDDTLNKLLTAQASDKRIKIIDLSRNFGKEAALTAGLDIATGDVVVPLDVDLQDPPDLILTMIEKWKDGFEVVLARRSDRSSDSWLKRTSAKLFYRAHNQVSEIPLPENVGDFRLMDKKVVQALRRFSESRRFMKGLFSWVGFRSTCVDYVRPTRSAGTTKFNGWKLWNFAIEGITSFSTVPLRAWTYIGVMVSFTSILFALFIAVRVVAFGVDVPGYPSIIVAVTFLGGLQLLGIGVIGEYLGRVYIESKNRPTYIVRSYYNSEK